MLRPGLYTGTVMHQRLRPFRRRFSYRCLWLLLDLGNLPAPSRLFAVDRFRLFSFHERDHADGGSAPLRERIVRRASDMGIACDGRVLLLTTPRILGHVFNPLSIYFCHDQSDRLTGIVWEVSSTFGERHSYVLPVHPAKDGTVRQSCAKALHVSPFLGMDIVYRFRVTAADEALSVGIADCDSTGVIMTAAFQARHRPLADRALLSALLQMVTYPFKTMLAIHWEAMLLALRGLPLFRHSARSDRAITAYSASSI